MLLGVLLIKTLPSKCISQIRLDKKKKKNTEEGPLKKTKKEEDFQRMTKKKRDLRLKGREMTL